MLGEVRDRPTKGLGSWVMRRRFMWVITVFCMASISWILYHDGSSPTDTAVVTCAFACLGAIVGSYVFGAAWQDINFRRLGERMEEE